MTKTYHSDPKGRKFLSAAAFALTIVIIAALNILRQYVGEKFPEYMPTVKSGMNLPERVIVALMIVFAAIYVIFIVILLPMWYKTIRYVITDKQITASSGLFSHTSRIMKISAVQHASLISLPLAKITCFNFISVNALGGQLMMMFLSEKDCREILDRLSADFSGKEKTETEAVQPVQEAYHGKYSVSYSSDGNTDYVYTDNSSILSSSEVNDVFDDFSGYTQLTFGEQASSQLTFGDIENDGSGGDKD